MRFQSRKDVFFISIIFGTIGLLLMIAMEILSTNFQWVNLLIFVFIILVIGFLLWIFFDTSYKLSEDEFIYRSGPLRGKITINRITEVVKGKTLWAGIKPATAKNGLIIKYDKYNELYISPKTNDLFISKLLELNSEIRIIE